MPGVVVAAVSLLAESWSRSEFSSRMTSNVTGNGSMPMIRVDNDFNPLMASSKAFYTIRGSCTCICIRPSQATPKVRCKARLMMKEQQFKATDEIYNFEMCPSFPNKRHSRWVQWAELNLTSLVCLYLEWSLFEVIKVPGNWRQHSTG